MTMTTAFTNDAWQRTYCDLGRVKRLERENFVEWIGLEAYKANDKAPLPKRTANEFGPSGTVGL